MRTMVIIVAFAAAAFVWSSSVLADYALCNRVMVAIAHARGDATEEFKRRVAFLLETGKIGFSELARMATSEMPVSPFASDQHLPSDVVPHQEPFNRLIHDKRLDWNELRSFIEQMRAGVKRGREEGRVHEKATRNVLLPILLKTVTAPVGVVWPDIPFQIDSKVYLVASAGEQQIVVFDPLAGRLVSKLGKHASPLSSSDVMFESNATTYIILEDPDRASRDLGKTGSKLVVYDVMAGRPVKKIVLGRGNNSVPVVFKKDGVSYIAVTSEPASGKESSLVVREALTGKVIKTTPIGITGVSKPVVFEKDGAPYVIVETRGRRLLVIDPLGGTVVQKIRIPGSGPLNPITFKQKGTGEPAVLVSGERALQIIDPIAGTVGKPLKVPTSADVTMTSLSGSDGTSYVLMNSQTSRLSVMDLSSGKIIAKLTRRENENGDEGAKLFEMLGTPYLARHVLDPWAIEIRNVVTGKVLGTLDTGEMPTRAVVFTEPRTGVTYTVIGGKAKLYIFQLYGPLPKKERRNR